MKKLHLINLIGTMFLLGYCSPKITHHGIPQDYFSYNDSEKPRVWPKALYIPYTKANTFELESSEHVELRYSWENLAEFDDADKVKGSIPTDRSGKLKIWARDAKGNTSAFANTIAFGPKNLWQIVPQMQSPVQASRYNLDFVALAEPAEVAGYWTIKIGETILMRNYKSRHFHWQGYLPKDASELSIEWEQAGQTQTPQKYQVSVPVYATPAMPTFLEGKNYIVPPLGFEGRCNLRVAGVLIPFIEPYFPRKDRVTILCSELITYQNKTYELKVIANPDMAAILKQPQRYQDVEYWNVQEKKWQPLVANQQPQDGSITLKYNETLPSGGELRYQIISEIEKRQPYQGRIVFNGPLLQQFDFDLKKALESKEILETVVQSSPEENLAEQIYTQQQGFDFSPALKVTPQTLRFEDEDFSSLNYLGEDLTNFRKLKDPSEIFTLLFDIPADAPLFNSAAIMQAYFRAKHVGEPVKISVAELLKNPTGILATAGFSIVTQQALTSLEKFNALFLVKNFPAAVLFGVEAFESKKNYEPLNVILGTVGKDDAYLLTGPVNIVFDLAAPRSPARNPSPDHKGDNDAWRMNPLSLDYFILLDAFSRYANLPEKTLRYEQGYPLVDIYRGAGGWVKIKGYGAIRTPARSFYLHDLLLYYVQSRWKAVHLTERKPTLKANALRMPLKAEQITQALSETAGKLNRVVLDSMTHRRSDDRYLYQYEQRKKISEFNAEAKWQIKKDNLYLNNQLIFEKKRWLPKPVMVQENIRLYIYPSTAGGYDYYAYWVDTPPGKK